MNVKEKALLPGPFGLSVLEIAWTVRSASGQIVVRCPVTFPAVFALSSQGKMHYGLSPENGEKSNSDPVTNAKMPFEYLSL